MRKPFMRFRRAKPFVRVNCAAIPEQLLESELFGHEEGAFTDAKRKKKGIFVEADSGTLFLDEIGELPLPMQSKLLSALQNSAVRPVGANAEVPIDVRIIAATNRDLVRLVNEKRFRLDLFYRLNVVPIRLLPLRERLEDIAPLAELFAEEFLSRYGIDRRVRFTQAAIAQAAEHTWPGNVRELKNVVARTLVALGPRLEAADAAEVPIERLRISANEDFPSLPDEKRVPGDAPPEPGPLFLRTPQPEASDPAPAQASHPICSFEAMQRRYFTALLEETAGKIAGPGGAAAIARLHPNTLRSRLEKLGMAGWRSGQSSSD